MTTKDENLAALRKLYDALIGRDVAVLAEALVDTIYHVPGSNPISGTYRGAEEILTLFARTAELTEGNISFELHDVVAGETHAAGLDHITARRGDRTLDQNRALIAHMADGKPTEIWLIPQDEYAFDEFWS